ncbi:MAG: phosphoribosylamine--glycine ligase, partial [Nitrososphaerota archaeon]|nr:phosphoribosylamine--glycine ligase [Nitrososphaerota archaeon]
GREISLMAISDGTTAIPFGTATDYKRALDGDKGPNTGGMGAYSPTLDFGDEAVENVMHRIVLPSIRKSGYRGFLYAGLMLTSEGPVVIEFNSRLGDPETQVILPRLDSDLFETLSNISNPDWHGLADMKLQWTDDWYCTVVMCSKGYPSKPKVGDEISGIQNAEKMDQSVIFHSGTIRSQGKLLTNGGRVLCVTAGGRTLEESSTRAYSTVEMISWQGEHHRHDIGCPQIPKRGQA